MGGMLKAMVALLLLQGRSEEPISFAVLLGRFGEANSGDEVRVRARLLADGHEYFITDEGQVARRFDFRGYSWPRALPLRKEARGAEGIQRTMSRLEKGLSERQLGLSESWVECIFAGRVKAPAKYRMFRRRGDLVPLGVGDQSAYAAEFFVQEMVGCVVFDRQRSREVFRVTPSGASSAEGGKGVLQ